MGSFRSRIANINHYIDCNSDHGYHADDIVTTGDDIGSDKEAHDPKAGTQGEE